MLLSIEYHDVLICKPKQNKTNKQKINQALYLRDLSPIPQGPQLFIEQRYDSSHLFQSGWLGGKQLVCTWSDSCPGKPKDSTYLGPA